MNIETFVLVGVIYAIGCYVTAFLLGIRNAVYGVIGDEEADWFMGIFWPICVLILIVLGLGLLCQFSLSKMRNRFPAMTRFLQRTWKCVRTAIFAVSLVFRPVKLGKIVGKRICRNRV